MYNFVDTIEVTDLTKYLQDEAININGIFLDNEIEDFITTSVSGRDSVSYDINSEERVTGSYGNSYFGKRLKERILVINFKLTAPSASDLIDKFNQLKGYLTDEDLVIKFNDNLAWEYHGTLSEIANPPEGTLIFISSFEITCSDPLAYAVNPKGPFTATLDDEGRYFVEVNNEGTVDAPITMTATMNSENGYIGMYTDYAITEIGNKEEDDTKDYVQATTILNTTNFSEFTRYTGTNPENSVVGNTGTATVRNVGGKNYFHLSNAGTNNNAWHGASYVFNFPADGTGYVGSKNAYIYFNEVFWAGAMGQTGQTQVQFATKDNEFLCGFHMSKSDKKGNTAKWYMKYRDSATSIKTFKSGVFTTSHLDSQNPFNMSRGHADMRKRGSEITFFWWGGYPKINVPYLANKEVGKVYINMYANSNNSSMTYFDFRNIRVTNDSAEYVRDIKNRFPNKCIVKMTGSDSKIYVDGLPKLSEKVLGSNLYTVPPGKTKIYFECSEWCATPPTYQIEFTEVSV